jgi:hypothetical protein
MPRGIFDSEERAPGMCEHTHALVAQRLAQPVDVLDESVEVDRARVERGDRPARAPLIVVDQGVTDGERVEPRLEVRVVEPRTSVDHDDGRALADDLIEDACGLHAEEALARALAARARRRQRRERKHDHHDSSAGHEPKMGCDREFF